MKLSLEDRFDCTLEGYRLWHAYSLDLHSGEDHTEHLSESGFSRRLVDEVFTGQVDVVACSDGQQDGALMNLTTLGRHHSQQRLGINIKYWDIKYYK